jgi:hypothetical protein
VPLQQALQGIEMRLECLGVSC